MRSPSLSTAAVAAGTVVLAVLDGRGIVADDPAPPPNSLDLKADTEPALSGASLRIGGRAKVGFFLGFTATEGGCDPGLRRKAAGSIVTESDGDRTVSLEYSLLVQRELVLELCIIDSMSCLYKQKVAGVDAIHSACMGKVNVYSFSLYTHTHL